ncbi:MAG: hypothetical protein M3457_07590 [Chloroflexota bacterium]|nr:hypothetical protein [Chloroflexota bacterium]
MADTTRSDPFVITGKVKTTPDDKPKRDALVLAIVLDIEKRSSVVGLVGQARTNQAGNFRIDVDPGDYLQLLGTDGKANILVHASVNDVLSGMVVAPVSSEQKKTDVTIALRGDRSAGTTPGNDDDHRDRGRSGQTAIGAQDNLIGEVIDAIAGIGGRSPGATRGAGASEDLDQIFNDAMFRVLGQRVRPDQPRDLRTAFDRVFVEKDVDGRSEVEYRGTSGTATLPIEGGSVTSGRQAVIYRRAHAELDVVRQALAELEADNDDDQDEFEAVRAVVDRKLIELVGALGKEVRPPIKRVDAVFALLIGPEGTSSEGSSLATLGELVGFTDSDQLIDDLVGFNANGNDNLKGGGDITRDDDRMSTRYLEVALYVTGLRSNWLQLKNQFGQPASSIPLGTQLDLLARLLDRLGEETDDLDVALTMSDVDSAQREFVVISKQPETTLAELMDWLSEFSVTGKSFDSGPGIDAVRQTATAIHALVKAALKLATGPQGNASELRSRRVKSALVQLSSILAQVEKAGI